MNRVIFCIEIDLLHCLVTKGTAFGHKQLKKILKECDWLRVDIVLLDKGSDTRNCFNKITNHGSIPGIKIRKNTSRKAHDCPSRRKAVLAQQQDIESWKIKKSSSNNALCCRSNILRDETTIRRIFLQHKCSIQSCRNMAENYPMECAYLLEVRIITQSIFSSKNLGLQRYSIGLYA
jgi:hypothetical protein